MFFSGFVVVVFRVVGFLSDTQEPRCKKGFQGLGFVGLFRFKGL